MLKSNCICIVLVIVAICIITAIFIICFCTRKNNYSRFGGGKLRGGTNADITDIRKLINELGEKNIINVDERNTYIQNLDNLDNKINNYIQNIKNLDTKIKKIKKSVF